MKKGKDLDALVARSIDWKDAKTLSTRFVSETGKILPRRQTGLGAKTHRLVAKNIKIARIMGVLPFYGSITPVCEEKEKSVLVKIMARLVQCRAAYSLFLRSSSSANTLARLTGAACEKKKSYIVTRENLSLFQLYLSAPFSLFSIFD